MDVEFTEFIGFVLDHEGRYYEDDPNDRGNAGDGKTPGNVGTHFGVDAASHPGVDIVHLTEDQALAIYWNEWQAERVECIPHPADLVYYDDCVNAGRSPATIILQKAYNSLYPKLAPLAVDGELGPITLTAVKGTDGSAMGFAMVELRDEHYEAIAKANPAEARYLNGWLSRVGDLRRWISGYPMA